MSLALSQPEPMPKPPAIDFTNLPALTLLMDLFHELSDEPVENADWFRREVSWRWRTWDQAAPIELPSVELGGRFVLNLLEKTLRVRFIHDEAGCVARLLIRLDSPLGLVAQDIVLADHHSATDVGSALLRRIQDTWPLKSLEYSVVKALARRLSVQDLAREMET